MFAASDATLGIDSKSTNSRTICASCAARYARTAATTLLASEFSCAAVRALPAHIQAVAANAKHNALRFIILAPAAMLSCAAMSCAFAVARYSLQKGHSWPVKNVYRNGLVL